MDGGPRQALHRARGLVGEKMETAESLPDGSLETRGVSGRTPEVC